MRNLYRVYDRVTCTYGDLFSAMNDNEAIRSVRVSMEGRRSMLYTSHADYEVFYVGRLDDQLPLPVLPVPGDPLLVATCTSIRADIDRADASSSAPSFPFPEVTSEKKTSEKKKGGRRG